MAIYFIFVDGLGLGKKEKSNPLNDERWEFFNEITHSGKLLASTDPVLKPNSVFKPIDANLDIEGLPQSGTGQVSLFTGINAAKAIGKHFGPYPHSMTKPLLREHNLIKRVFDLHRKFYFMNAYPPVFFNLSEQKDRWSTTTLMCRYNDLKLHSIDEVLNKEAITSEMTQEIWNDRLKLTIPAISCEAAANRMVNKALSYDLVLFEYYLTDKAGHEQNLELSREVLHRLDRFLMELMINLKDQDLLLLTSDHGNIEDLSIKTHTRNPVPLIALGHQAAAFASADSLVDLVPLVENHFKKNPNGLHF